MELLQLRYFLITAEYQHMTKAAESLHIAQPALSQSIKRLEKELGVKLFIRSGRNIKLSDAGKLLYEKVIPVISAVDEIPPLMAEAAGHAGKTIRVNIQSASELITDIIILYKELHPDVNFRLSQRSDDEDWDIRISTVVDQHSLQFTHSVLSEEIFLAVPVDSSFSEKNELALSEAAQFPFITLAPNKPFSQLTHDYCLAAGFTPKLGFESDSPETVRDLIGAGMGVAFWPAYSWGKQESDKVKLLHICEPKCTRQLYVTRKKEKPSLSLKNDFYMFMLEYLNKVQLEYFKIPHM